MRKRKTFPLVKFSPVVISEALQELKAGGGLKNWPFAVQRTVTFVTGETWSHDTNEEFFADYRRDDIRYGYLYAMGQDHALTVDFENYRGRQPQTNLAVEAGQRALIESVFTLFENAVEQSRLPAPPKKPEPPPPKPTLFVGHGRDQQWRDLKDHLHEKHGFPVQAYEIGARAGHTVRDILEDMLSRSSFALLVLTGEDEDKEGKLHARDNVIHEVGLFQGHLGWTRAIALLEEDTVEFSNIHGIQQIRFKRGNIATTFGEILATIAREFPS